MTRRELLAFAAELSETAGFPRQTALGCRRLLELLSYEELLTLVGGAVEQFRRELAEA